MADQGGDVAVVTVALRASSPQRAASVARANGVTTLPLLLGDASLRKQIGVVEVPATLVVGRDGRAVRLLMGERDQAGFERALEDL